MIFALLLGISYYHNKQEDVYLEAKIVACINTIVTLIFAYIATTIPSSVDVLWDLCQPNPTHVV